MLAKLRAMAGRTTAAGCSEAEALSAAEMLGKMLDQYGFSHADLGKVAREEIKEHRLTECGAVIGNVSRVATSVADFCDVKVWKSTMDGSLTFFGRESDCLVAKQMMISFYHAVGIEWFLYKRANPGVAKQPNAKKSFEFGMVGRLASRVREMKMARSAHVDQASGKTGQSLVVQRIAEVDEAMEARNIKIGKARKSRVTRNVSAQAWVAGQSAADRVNITTGITAT